MYGDLLYENGRIRVSTHLFVNDKGKQFVLAGHGVRSERKAKPLFMMLIGIALSAIAGFAPELLSIAYGPEIVGGLGVLFVLYYFTDKDKYIIYLGGAQGEVKALTTTDERLHDQVYKCLRQATQA